MTKANSCVFFGDEIGKALSNDRRKHGLHGIVNDSVFLDAAQQYPQDVFATGEILRFTPSFLAPSESLLQISHEISDV